MPNPNWKKGVPQLSGQVPSRRTQNQKLASLELIVTRIAKDYKRIVDPAEILLMIGAGIDPLDNSIIKDLDVRMEAAKAVINYYRPKLSQVELSGNDDKPIAIDARVSERLSTDSGFRAMAEAMVIKQVELLGQHKLLEEAGIIDADESEDDGPDEGIVKP